MLTEQRKHEYYLRQFSPKDRKFKSSVRLDKFMDGSQRINQVIREVVEEVGISPIFPEL